MDIDIEKEISEFIDKDNESDLAVKHTEAKFYDRVIGLGIWVDEDKSNEWNIAHLQNILECDPEMDCGDYNFDIALLALRIEQEINKQP